MYTEYTALLDKKWLISIKKCFGSGRLARVQFMAPWQPGWVAATSGLGNLLSVSTGSQADNCHTVEVLIESFSSF